MPNIKRLRLLTGGTLFSEAPRTRDPLTFFSNLSSLDISGGEIPLDRCLKAAQHLSVRDLRCFVLDPQDSVPILPSLTTLTLYSLYMRDAGRLNILLAALPQLVSLDVTAICGTAPVKTITDAVSTHAPRLVHLRLDMLLAAPPAQQNRPANNWLLSLPRLKTADIHTAFLADCPLVVAEQLEELILNQDAGFSEGWSQSKRLPLPLNATDIAAVFPLLVKPNFRLQIYRRQWRQTTLDAIEVCFPQARLILCSA